MQDIRIISVVTCEDEATAQAAADAVAVLGKVIGM